ncbi:hypothetical protein GCM10010532_094090 [Dactylosporangium siamense]|uniref:Uncharacterized protein n=1 Tax=Dactylosporangium siamense TaxID=685454 RepID=A0A919UG42_9ACTN|nr:hypothetical protein Dsi01nite_082860 [Dactylosporangium siamense]
MGPDTGGAYRAKRHLSHQVSVGTGGMLSANADQSKIRGTVFAVRDNEPIPTASYAASEAR